MIKISTRLVLILPTVVIKFPLSYRGYLQGKNESYLYEKYSLCGYFAKLYWEKFGIVCMKKYKTCKYIPSSNVILIKKSVPELNVELCDLFNYKNWGIDNGRYILLDYGINEGISKMY